MERVTRQRVGFAGQHAVHLVILLLSSQTFTVTDKAPWDEWDRVLLSLGASTLSESFIACRGGGEAPRFSCRICQHSQGNWMTNYDLQKHEKGDYHRLQVEQRVQALIGFNNKCKQVGALCPNVRTIQSHPPCVLKLFWYVFDPASEPSWLEAVRSELDHLVKVEPLVLLELTVWKLTCQLHPPKPLRSISDHLTWFAKGWKAEKAVRRHDAMIEVIMKHVAPFCIKAD